MASWRSLTLAMIFIYSTQLALVVLSALLLYALLRLALYRVLWLRTEATIQAAARRELDLHRDACGRSRA